MKTKKNLLYISMAASLLCAACSNSDDLDPVPPQTEIEESDTDQEESPAAEQVTLWLNDENAETRTTLDGVKVVWSEGDEILVNGTQKSYPVTLTEEGAFVTVDKAEDGNYYAFYPAAAATAYDAETHTYTFNQSAEQVYGGDSTFADGVNPMVAAAEGTETLTFHHLFGVVKLLLSSSAEDPVTVGRITMRCNEYSVPLYGEGFKAVCAPAAEDCTCTAPDTANELTLTVGNLTLAAEETGFCFVVPCRSYAKGFTFRIYDADGNALRIYASEKVQTVKQGVILKMPSIDTEEAKVSVESYTDEASGDCWYKMTTSGPARISATDIWDAAYRYKDEESPCCFDFSGADMEVTDDRGYVIFPAAFSEHGKANLKLINLPKNLTEICDNAFNGCAKLEEVKYEGSLNYIGNTAFAGCTSLKKIYAFSEKPARLGATVFDGVAEGGTVYANDPEDYTSDAYEWYEQLLNLYQWTAALP